MEYETAIDYFQVVNDEKGMPRGLGVSMLPEGLKDLYLRVSSEGSLSLAPLSYGYSTVLSERFHLLAATCSYGLNEAKDQTSLINY